MRRWLLKLAFAIYERLVAPVVNWLFFAHLLHRTRDFDRVQWMGKRTWQSVLDLWVFQEAVWEVKPELIIETGTNQAGSAFFYAHLCDILGRGRIVTIDTERQHDHAHPRIEFLVGDSVAPEIVARVRALAAETTGPVLVVLDSDHSEGHVLKELEAYAPLVTPGSYLWVQDGVIDTHAYFRYLRPGPVPAIKRFLQRHPEFEVDHEKCGRFLITEHPLGWLRRKF